MPDQLHVRSAALSDIGKVRTNNEDAFAMDQARGLYVVADGMGGHAAGETASRMACEWLMRAADQVPDKEFLDDPSLKNRRRILDWLSETVADANAAIYQASQENSKLRGMGCTLDVALIRGGGAFIAHVGDSRVYTLRDGQLSQLTEDHTIGQMLLSSGRIKKEEFDKHPRRNVLLRALGILPQVEVDVVYYELNPADRILLCSDGVHGELPDDTIRAILKKDVIDAPRALVAAALTAGGEDNITALVIGVGDDGAGAHPTIGDNETMRAMRASSLFAPLNDAELLRAQRIAIQQEYRAGDVIFRAGNSGDALYVIVSGQVAVAREAVAIARLGPGEHFGEMALIDDAPRSATVTVEAPTRLLCFPRVDFENLVANDMVIANKLFRQLIGSLALRLRDLNNEVTIFRRALVRGMEAQRRGT